MYGHKLLPDVAFEEHLTEDGKVLFRWSLFKMRSAG